MHGANRISILIKSAIILYAMRGAHRSMISPLQGWHWWFTSVEIAHSYCKVAKLLA